MRGIAALLVLVTHAAGIAATGNRASNWFTLTGLFGFDNFGAIGVDLFFIISGFVMAYAVAPKSGLRPAGEFLVMRWVRVFPPYLVASLAMLAMLIVQRNYGGWLSIFNVVAFVPWFDSTSYTVPPLSVGWTLSFEISFYLMIALMITVRLSRHIAWLAGAITLLVIAGQFFTDGPFIVRWFTNPIFLEFAFGIIAYVLWRRGIFQHRRRLWGLAGVVGAAALVPQAISGTIDMAKMEYVLDGSLSMQRVLLWGIPTLLIFVSVLAFDRQCSGRMAEASAKLGDASYSLYLAHMLSLTVVTYVFEKIPFTVSPDIVFVVCLAAGLYTGFAFYRFVEKPVTRYLQHRATAVLAARDARRGSK